MFSVYVTSDFRLTFAKSYFFWSKAPRPGLPILRWPDGTLCEPAMYYFGYSAVEKRVKISSMRPEAYSLREYFTWLANEGLRYLDTDDEVLEKWRTSQGWMPIYHGRRKAKLTPKQLAKNVNIERKLHHVFEFYRNLPYAMPWEVDGTRTPCFVGNNKPEARFPIGLKKRYSKRKKIYTDVWVRSQTCSPPSRLPKVTTPAEVTALYNHLRGQAFKAQQRLKLAFPPKRLEMLSSRNWLMARTMAAGGLRCEEVSALSVPDLAKALYDSGVTKVIVDLQALRYNQVLKTTIKQRVLSLQEGDEFAFILVKITGKGPDGGKERHAPFPPQLICDLLDGVWGFRSEQIALQIDATMAVEDHVFLSEKTYGQLDPGTIGDVIGKGFRAIRIGRSAHSLRGYFATVTAAALWKEYFAQNHYHFDHALVNMVLDNLARYMGHAQITTTLKFYLDQPLFKHLTKIGTPEALLFRKLWKLIVMEKRTLSPKVGDLLTQLATRVSESDDNSRLVKALEIMLADPRFAAAPPAPQNKKGVRLVYEETERR